MNNAALLQDASGPIYGVTLGDPAQVDINPGMSEIERAGSFIQLDKFVIDGRQQLFSLPLAGLELRAIVVVTPERGKCNIKRAATHTSVVEGFVDKACQLRGNLQRLCSTGRRRQPVCPGQLTGLDIRTVFRINAPHLDRKSTRLNSSHVKT